MQFYDGHLSSHAAKVPGITSLDSSSALASATWSMMNCTKSGLQAISLNRFSILRIIHVFQPRLAHIKNIFQAAFDARAF